MTSKIIRGTPAPEMTAVGAVTGGGKVIEQEVLAAHQQARRIVEQAQLRAQGIVQEARQQCEEIRREARQKGYEEGLAQWESMILTVAAKSRQAVERIQPQLVALAVKVAEKILRRRLEERPEAIGPMLEEALQAARGYDAGRLSLHVHPQDVAALDGLRARLRGSDSRWRALEIVPEEGMSRGGCRIETEFGTIDASVETQLRVIEQLLLRGGT